MVVTRVQTKKMIDFTVSKIAQIIKGELFTPSGFLDHTILQIITDSRSFFKGENSIFFALIGPRNNGHNYISDLIKKGFKTFVVSDSSIICNDATFLLVQNTTLALQELAAFNRQAFKIPVIGITGSNGKTIIKEWLHDLLSGEFKIVRSPKSYNSQVGVPLSVLLMNNIYNLGIFEAGISKPGEMANLEKIIRPEIGILTNIGDAHQENFETYKQKINEKLILFEKAKKLIYCVDNKKVKTEIENFCKNNLVENIGWTLNYNNATISFSLNKQNDFTEINALAKNKNYSFTIPFSDNSAIENACHCFVAAFVLLKNPKPILPHFKNLEAVAMRLEIKQGINNSLLINDYYNSDLHSLTIALSVLHQQASKGHLHKLVILSDIQQTGIPQNQLYKRVNELLHEWKINEIIGIGPIISNHYKLFSVKKKFFNSINEFNNQFKRNDFNKAVILIKGARQFTFEKISMLLQQKAHQTVLEINLDAMVHNLNAFRFLLKPETKIMVMVKAFSYGSGDVEIAKLLQFQQVDYLAVAVADEGVGLRNAGIQTPIIVMNPELHSFQNIIDYQLEPNIYSIELLDYFLKTASKNGLQDFPIHLKLDTGMNRLGLKSEDEINEVISLILSSKSLKVVSAFSHLAASDEPGLDNFTKKQIDNFEKLFKIISIAFPYKINRHILNSAGIERFPEYQYEMVRLGIGLYGISQTGLALKNIGTLKSTVSQIKNVQADETIGYNRKGKITHESEIAIVPLGYADGLNRKLGNKNGSASVKGKRVAIIGNICMDMLMLDVSGLSVKPGDVVEFFGPNISVSEVAEKAGTIPYEILSGISQRVKRIFLHE